MWTITHHHGKPLRQCPHLYNYGQPLGWRQSVGTVQTSTASVIFYVRCHQTFNPFYIGEVGKILKQLSGMVQTKILDPL